MLDSCCPDSTDSYPHSLAAAIDENSHVPFLSPLITPSIIFQMLFAFSAFLPYSPLKFGLKSRSTLKFASCRSFKFIENLPPSLLVLRPDALALPLNTCSNMAFSHKVPPLTCRCRYSHCDPLSFCLHGINKLVPSFSIPKVLTLCSNPSQLCHHKNFDGHQ
jgi:hypothetical protein